MRCFFIKTKHMPHIKIHLAKTKIPARGFFKTFFRKTIICLPSRKIRIVTKRKIYAYASVMAFAITIILITQMKKENQSIPVFNIYNPDEIVSDVLPTEKEPGFISGIKEKLSSLKKNSPGEIVKGYGGALVAISSPSPSPIPANPSKPTEIITEAKTIPSEQLLKNDTDYSVSENLFSDYSLGFSKNPTVLIIHTHTTECYTQNDSSALPDNGRSTDDTKNMISVGKVIKEELESSGINVIHDTTFHDYPSYQGAYGRSLSTAKKRMTDNNNIELILDIHRDAVTNESGGRVKLVKNINGTEYAQLMIVCGTDGGGLSHPGWKDNLNFAVKIQQSMNKSYPGLMRPINLRKERFNQHLTPGSLIIEVGTHGNSLQEAKNSAVLIAKKIGELITK